MRGDLPPPRATYRLQLTPGFGFEEAARLLDYLRDLGISHVYLSPVLQAAPGSEHGYDVVDPACVDRDRGGARAFARLLDRARGCGLGVLLDIVPNHMSTRVPANRYWWDVLRQGRRSPFARWFDVDWEPQDPDLRGKVLLPVLAAPLGEVLRDPGLRVVEDGEEAVLELPGGMRLPLSRESVVQGLHRGSVRALLGAQHYVVEHWRTGLRRLNWRRFFDISGLIGVRVEDPEVFEATHALLLEHVRAGAVAGLRVDHPDGLRDPAGYFQRLRAAAPAAWVLAEKILGPGEELPADWPVEGTTGYDFLNLATGILVDRDAEPALSALALEFGDPDQPFEELQHDAKQEVLASLFPGELDRLAHVAREATGADADACRQALCALLAAMPVYRTYLRATEPAAATDRKVLATALRAALGTRPDNPEVLQQLHDCLSRETGAAASELAARFQQLSATLTAKGVEDTAFYRHHRLLCLNEVGGEPGRFGVSPEEFHAFCRRRAQSWPLALNATSTHDTKRSEDVRCRLAVLSEMVGEWGALVRRWRARHHREAQGVDDPMMYYLYQTLAGCWPVSAGRLGEHLRKAAREAKERTSWHEPDPEYEAALLAFAEHVVADAATVSELEDLVGALEPAARRNSLALTLLKCTAPGVPDVYQGSELWYCALTDPDNRRPVDHALRRNLLRELRAGGARPQQAHSGFGALKLWVLHRALAVREQRPAAFVAGSDHQALKPVGTHARRVLAFSRGGSVITVVPRLTLGMKTDRDGWKDTRLHLPPGPWHDALTGEPVRSTGLGNLLGRLPVALLVR